MIGPLVVGDRFLLDHRRQRHDVADAQPRRRHDVVQARSARPREDVPSAVELALHAPHDVARVAVEAASRRWRERGTPPRCRRRRRARAGASRRWSRRGSRAAARPACSWSRRAMSKRFHPSGNVTRAVPAEARRSRRAISSRGLASSARRCLPITTPLVPPVARTQSAKRRGLETTPAPASAAARPAGRRVLHDHDLDAVALPGPSRRRIEDEEPRGRGERGERRSAAASAVATRAEGPSSARAGAEAPSARRPGGSLRARFACAASAGVATGRFAAARHGSFRRACRASSHDWRIAQAAASSMCARAFFPRTSLAASARCAWTVDRRSSQSSTTRPVASATSCARRRASRGRRPLAAPACGAAGRRRTAARSPPPPAPGAPRASALGSRGSRVPRGCARRPSSSSTATPIRARPGSSAQTRPARDAVLRSGHGRAN